MTAFQAAVCAHDITIYGPQGSQIIPFTENIAARLGLPIEMEENHIRIDNGKGKFGSVTLRTIPYGPTGYNDPTSQFKNDELAKLLIADAAMNPFELIHVHSKMRIPLLAAAGLLPLVVAHEHDLPSSNMEIHQSYRYPVIAISQSQAEHFCQIHDPRLLLGVAYHGLDSFTFHYEKDTQGYTRISCTYRALR